MTKDNNNFEDDPRYNPYYYFGLSFYTSGILLLTMMPALMHYHFFYPDNPFFTTPGALFLLIALILWRFAPDTELYQSVIVGTGLIFYGVFQSLIKVEDLTAAHLCIYLAIIITGSGFVFSAYNIFKKSIKKDFNYSILYTSAVFSAIIILFMILTNV